MKKLVSISLVAALFSTVSLTVGVGDLRVSLGILILVIGLEENRNINAFLTAAVTGLFVFITRFLLDSYFKSSGDLSLVSYLIEVSFYLSYIVIYNVIFVKKVRESNFPSLVAFMICDLLANLIELFLRDIFNSRALNLPIFTLFFASFIRSSAIALIITYLSFRSVLLLKKDHEERYNNLILMMSNLDMSFYLLKKNQDYIESVMSDSYALYEKIACGKDDYEWKDRSLVIAKNIHEIKKEHLMVFNNIGELREKRYKIDEGILLTDLVKILTALVSSFVKEEVDLKIKCDCNFITKKHYLLISIFRNIIINAIEAKDQGKKNFVEVKMYKDEDNFYFETEDTGVGIKEKDMERIFKPGFSTKINFETGQIGRGLGLPLIKDILEENLNGEISYKSVYGKGTSCLVRIPLISLEA